GLMLTQMLEQLGIDVLLVEQKRERAKFLSEKLRRTLVLVGDGTDANLLRGENIDTADAFIGTSGDDEDNIISGLLAKELGVKTCVAVVERPEYTTIGERLGIDVVVSPRQLTVNEIVRYVRRGNVKSVAILEKEKVELIELEASHESEIAGKKLKDARFPRGSIVGCVLRGGKFFLPRGEDTIEAGDTLIVFTVVENIPKLEKILM
ncbi:MAG: NAD-binding protein, partial [bacterium]